jgi:hypothetical protein
MTAEISIIGMRIRRICCAVTLLHFPLKGEMSAIDRADTIRSFYNLWELIYELIWK